MNEIMVQLTPQVYGDSLELIQNSANSLSLINEAFLGAPGLRKDQVNGASILITGILDDLYEAINLLSSKDKENTDAK